MIRDRDRHIFDNGMSNCYIALDQGAFVDSVLEQLTITLKDFDSPMASTSNLLPNPDPKEDADPAVVRSYQSAIGSLMYIMLGTRPDLAVRATLLFSSQRAAERLLALTNPCWSLPIGCSWFTEVESKALLPCTPLKVKIWR